jgi:aspartate/methionine/tyrosine aminotransferase
MWIASPDFRIAPETKAALLEAVEAEDLCYNTDEAAREVMAEKIRRVNGVEVGPENVRITQGLDSFLWLAVRHACDPWHPRGCVDACIPIFHSKKTNSHQWLSKIP